MRLLALTLMASIGCATTPRPRLEPRPDMAARFADAGLRGTFVLYDASEGRYLVHDEARARKGFVPASTFKIFNSLAALDAGVVKDEKEVFRWDGQVRRIAAWNQDLDMEKAFQVSGVWFYQELARRIGAPRMDRYLRAVGYGNKRMGDAIDRFWLQGGTAISALEQIEFLRRLERRDLPFSSRAIETVKRMMIVEAKDGYVLRGKTGWADAQQPNLGWYVGYVEKGDDDYFFAMNVDLGAPEQAPLRVKVTRQILIDRGILPP